MSVHRVPRLPTQARQAEIVAAALQLASPTSPPLITTAEIAAVVDVGDTVQAGQLPAELDPVDIAGRLLALDASRARAGSTAAAAAAQRKDALAKKELAAINARRYADLASQNFISAGALEARLQEQTSAVAAVAAAVVNLDAARQDMDRLAAERAALRQQRDNLRLPAPATGLVTHRDAEQGSTVVSGQAVVQRVDPAWTVACRCWKACAQATRWSCTARRNSAPTAASRW